MTRATSAVSIFDALPEAEKRKWEAERRIVRDGIRKAKAMPKRDRECLMYLCNLWFYHRNGDGFIHPGAKLLAARLECSERTVKSTDLCPRPRGFSLDWDEAMVRSVAQINRAKTAANRAKAARGIQGKDQDLPETFGDASDWSEVPF